MDNLQKMRDIYHKPSTGFRRRDLFLQQTKTLIPKPTVKEVKVMLNKDRSYGLHKRPLLSDLIPRPYLATSLLSLRSPYIYARWT